MNLKEKIKKITGFMHNVTPKNSYNIKLIKGNDCYNVGINNIYMENGSIIFTIPENIMDTCYDDNDCMELCAHCLSILMCMGENVLKHDLMYIINCILILRSHPVSLNRIINRWKKIQIIRDMFIITFPRKKADKMIKDVQVSITTHDGIYGNLIDIKQHSMDIYKLVSV